MALCRLIHPSNKPCYVEVRPSPLAWKLECFENVRAEIRLRGGRFITGWALWQPSGFFLAAEHHAVYEPLTGPPWLDITPHNSIATRILFLPDETAIDDVRRRRDNVRMPLVIDDRFSEFNRLCGELNDISWRKHPGTEQRLLETKQRCDFLRAELDEAHPLPKLSRNDRCLCGGERKYGECHGRQ